MDVLECVKFPHGGEYNLFQLEISLEIPMYDATKGEL